MYSEMDIKISQGDREILFQPSLICIQLSFICNSL